MFWSIIQANKRKTVLLVVLMGFFLILFGGVIGLYFSNEQHPSAAITGALVAAAVWLGMLLMSLYASDVVLLDVCRAREVSKETTLDSRMTG